MGNSNNVFVVTRQRISASDYRSNGYIDMDVFLEKSSASAIFNEWREEELNERVRLNDEYEILSDSREKFHCAWDCHLEMVIISINRHVVK